MQNYVGVVLGIDSERLVQLGGAGHFDGLHMCIDSTIGVLVN